MLKPLPRVAKGCKLQLYKLYSSTGTYSSNYVF